MDRPFPPGHPFELRDGGGSKICYACSPHFRIVQFVVPPVVPAILVCRRWERQGETASVTDAAAVRYEMSGPVSPFVVIVGLWPGGIRGCLPGGRRERRRKLQPSLPKGNRHMRPTLNQSSNAAAKAKGTIFGMIYRRMVPRLGHKQTAGAIAHRQCRLIWLILHQGVRYGEGDLAEAQRSKQRRAARVIRQLRSLGYRIEPSILKTSARRMRNDSLPGGSERRMSHSYRIPSS